MKGLVYNGPLDVSVEEVPDAKIKRPTDVLVKITTTNICGSDLHMYEGRTDLEAGRVIGHENLGEVIEVGDALKVTVGPPGSGGGGVVVPFTKETSSITRVPALSIKWYTDAFVTFVGTVNVAVNCFHAFADDVTFVTHP